MELCAAGGAVEAVEGVELPPGELRLGLHTPHLAQLPRDHLQTLLDSSVQGNLAQAVRLGWT